MNDLYLTHDVTVLWWTCGECGFRLSATTVLELIECLDGECPMVKAKIAMKKRLLSVSLAAAVVGIATALGIVFLSHLSSIALFAILIFLVVLLIREYR